METTGIEAGLSQDDQIRIALQCMSESGGVASLEQIFRALEDHMGDKSLSVKGKNFALEIMNNESVKNGFIHPPKTNSTDLRITPAGEEFLLKYAGEGFDKEKDSDDQVNFDTDKPYDPKKIKVDLKPFSIFQVMMKIKNNEIDLRPDFQRNIVWNDLKQSRLIESILINLPLPTLYLDATNESKWLVVDGLQRLWTLDRFYNKHDLKLSGLEFLTKLDGCDWDTLPRQFQRRIEETFLQLYLIQPETQPSAKFTIFSRVNTGGLFLTAQEIRHALFQGKATILIKKLSESPEFIATTTGSIPTKRMEDHEIVLRFLAFYLSDYHAYKQPNFDIYLSNTMEMINNFNDVQINEISELFLLSMKKAEKIFGNNAFRKIFEKGIFFRYPINKSLFEVWSVLLTKYDLNIIENCKEKILERFIDIMNDDEDFLRSISQGTGSVKNVQVRFSSIERLLQEVVE